MAGQENGPLDQVTVIEHGLLHRRRPRPALGVGEEGTRGCDAETLRFGDKKADDSQRKSDLRYGGEQVTR